MAENHCDAFQISLNSILPRHNFYLEFHIHYYYACAYILATCTNLKNNIYNYFACFLNSIYKCYHPFFATCFWCCCFTLHFLDESGFTQMALVCSFFFLLHILQCCSMWIVYKLLTFFNPRHFIYFLSLVCFSSNSVMGIFYTWVEKSTKVERLDFRYANLQIPLNWFSKVVAILYTLHGHSKSSSIFCIIELTKLLPIS